MKDAQGPGAWLRSADVCDFASAALAESDERFRRRGQAVSAIACLEGVNQTKQLALSSECRRTLFFRGRYEAADCKCAKLSLFLVGTGGCLCYFDPGLSICRKRF